MTHRDKPPVDCFGVGLEGCML